MAKRDQNVGKVSDKWEMMQRGIQNKGKAINKVEMKKRSQNKEKASEKWEIMQRGSQSQRKASDMVEMKKRSQNKVKASDKWEIMQRGGQSQGKASDNEEASDTENPASDLEVDSSLDIKKILKEIELLGSAQMTWKERKALENKKVVALGGKPQKQQRLPLSVAKIPMKKQKERERNIHLENQLFGKFEGIPKLEGAKKKDKRHKPESKGLKPTEGYFRNGVLEVKHLLKSGGPSSERIPGRLDISLGGQGRDGGKKKGVGGKKKGKGGKKKGKGGKRR